MFNLKTSQWRTVPTEHRRNFIHLFFDIGWFGILNGSFVTFAAVYLTRLGATSNQLGWFTAAPAVGALLFSLPLGAWLRKQQVDRAVFWSSIGFRALYVLWLPLPILFPDWAQVNIAIGLTILFSVPGTALAIGFNALFADVVPSEWRNYVLGVRQGVLAIASIAASLLCGYLLDQILFPLNYQIVFGMGALGALMSSFHLWFVRSREAMPQRNANGGIVEYAHPGQFGGDRGIRPTTMMRYFLYKPSFNLASLSILRGEYGRILLVTLFFFFALYFPNPLYYPYWVSELGYSEQLIGMGTAAFYVCQFFGSMLLAQFSDRWGNRRVFGTGALFLFAYPGLSALFPQTAGFLVASTVTGIAWGIAGGAMLAYVLNVVPVDERPRYLAWYTLLTNGAILLAAFIAPQIAALIGVRAALGVAGLLRFSSGLIIWLTPLKSK